MANEQVLAVDIGGTKITAALVSSDGRVGQELTEPTGQSGPEEGIQQIINLCHKVMQGQSDQITAIGIGIPAVLEHGTDLVIWAPNIKAWRQVALRPVLENTFGVPVSIEYDGHTAVLGEWWAGAGRGTQTFVSVIIGTGVGGGIIANGKLLRGYSRVAGAAGWFAMTNNDRLLDNERVHNIGHWESLVAGPGIAHRAQAGLAAFPTSELHQTASSIMSEDVFLAAKHGDTYAKKIIRETAQIIGLGLANIVSLMNPERIVLGGGVGSQSEQLLPTVRETVKRWAQPASAEAVSIVSSRLGTKAGLLGAAYAAMNEDL